MKKLSWFLICVVGFIIVFLISAAVTFTLTLDKEEQAEEASEAVEQTAPTVTSVGEAVELNDETPVTRVTPSLRAEDAIVIRNFYGDVKKEEVTEVVLPDVADGLESLVIEEEKAEEKPETEKKEEVKTEEKKTEVKAEEKKTEVKQEEKPKTEEKKEEAKVEQKPVSEEKAEVKVEEKPAVEEKKEEVKVEVKEEVKVELDPNKQYSDTGL